MAAIPGGHHLEQIEGLALYLKMAGLALKRPRTVPYLLQAAWAFRSRDWYRRPPFLPLPPASYMKWRMETAYGDPEAVPTDDELERYLVWTARMRSQMKQRDSG
tara:strand:+ start:2182 stop:2493 length:312 start_codon:yes stop_codon:yes gene_type:complete